MCGNFYMFSLTYITFQYLLILNLIFTPIHEFFNHMVLHYLPFKLLVFYFIKLILFF
jgi:hypothetical protein